MQHYNYVKLTKEEEYQAWIAKDTDTLIYSVIPYIIKIAKKFNRDTDDLVQEGVAVLLSKLNKFDPTKGRLSTFTTFIVHHAICNKLRRDKLIKTPVAYDEAARLNNVVHLNTVKPTLDFIREETSVADLFNNHEDLEQIKQIFEKYLDKRQQFIVTERCNNKKLVDIAKNLMISKQRAAQIYKQAIDIIQNKLKY